MHGAACVIVRECSLETRPRWPAGNLKSYKLKVGMDIQFYYTFSIFDFFCVYVNPVSIRHAITTAIKCSFFILIYTCIIPEFVDVTDVTEYSGVLSGPIFLDQLVCGGEEASLSECKNTTVHTCSHSDNVGIICHRKRMF